ncbi:MAG: bacteriocin [Bacteroidales bacterium]|nr:bacteriocin [Bacteroidales bacterium]
MKQNKNIKEINGFEPMNAEELTKIQGGNQPVVKVKIKIKIKG